MSSELKNCIFSSTNGFDIMISTLRWKGVLMLFLGPIVEHTASLGDRDLDPEKKEEENR